MGRMTVLSGAAGLSLPAAPKITMTEFEKAVANIPGLLHYIDPGRLKSNASGRDAMSGAMITSAGTNTITASSPDFSNNPIVTTANGGSGISLAPGSVTRSYTVIAVGRLATARFDDPQYSNLFLSTTAENTFIGGLRVTPENRLGLMPQDGASTWNALSLALSPARGAKAIYCASLDYDTKQSAVAYNNGRAFQLGTHTTVYDPKATDRWSVARNPFSTASGFPGDMALVMIFDRALHMPTNRPYLDDLMTRLRTKFALT